MSGCIVKKLVDLAHAVFRGGCLVGGNGSKGGEHHAADCAAVEKENPNYLLH